MTSPLLSLLVVTALSAEPEVNVRPLEGESFSGRLAELSPAKATVETAAGSKHIATAKLMWIELPSASPADKPTIWIDLLDGSAVMSFFRNERPEIVFVAAAGNNSTVGRDRPVAALGRLDHRLDVTPEARPRCPRVHRQPLRHLRVDRVSRREHDLAHVDLGLDERHQRLQRVSVGRCHRQ